MRADRPLIGAVIFLGLGLGLIFGYCTGTTGFSAAYPFSGSTLHVDFTTIGPAVIGGVALSAIGAVLLIWAILAAILTLFSGPQVTRERVERVVERYPVATTADGTPYTEVPVVTERKHFWSRPPAKTRD